MRALYAIIFITISTSVSSPCFAQDLDSSGACHLLPEEAARVEELREAMRVVSLAVGPGDEPTDIGLGVIDASCLTGAREPLRGRTIEAITRGISRAIQRSRRCLEQYRIIEMPDVISVLERTRFRCIDPAGDGLVASMRRTSRTYDSCGRGTSRYMAGAHRRYEMTLSVPAPGLPQKTNDSASTAMDTEELASFLAHEAMHVLAMNNRDWHNTFDMAERSFQSCDSSLFEDRIYFTQAACFPESPLGRDFYSDHGPYQCPGLCERALTEVDEGARLTYSASTAPGAERTFTFGPSQVARPYPPDEAQRICNRIHTSRGAVLR